MIDKKLSQIDYLAQTAEVLAVENETLSSERDALRGEVERLTRENALATANLLAEIERLKKENDEALDANAQLYEAGREVQIRAESAEKKIAAVRRLLLHHFVVAEAGEHEITDEVGISIRLLQQIEGVLMETETTNGD